MIFWVECITGIRKRNFATPGNDRWAGASCLLPRWESNRNKCFILEKLSLSLSWQGKKKGARSGTPSHCKVNSISDIFTPTGARTQVNLIWELIAEAIDGNRTRYTNKVTCHPTDAFMEFIAEQRQSFDDTAAARQAAGGHNHRETPKFAESIAAKARSRESAIAAR